MPETRQGLHWLDAGGIPCRRLYTTWTAPGITVTLEEVGCKRCLRYLANPYNYVDGKAMVRLNEDGTLAEVLRRPRP